MAQNTIYLDSAITGGGLGSWYDPTYLEGNTPSTYAVTDHFDADGEYAGASFETIGSDVPTSLDDFRIKIEDGPSAHNDDIFELQIYDNDSSSWVTIDTFNSGHHLPTSETTLDYTSEVAAEFSAADDKAAFLENLQFRFLYDKVTGADGVQIQVFYGYCTYTIGVKLLSGQINSVSSVSMDVEVETTLSGNINAISSASTPELKKTTPLSPEDVDAVSSTSCTIDTFTIHSLSGQVDAISGTSAPDLEIERELIAQVDAVASVVGSIQVELELSGSVSAIGTTEGYVEVETLLNPVDVVAVSSTSCTIDTTGEQTLSGQADGVSGTSGELEVETTLSGLVSGIASVAGDVEIEKTLDGQSDGIAGTSAVLEVETTLDGTVTAIASTACDLEVTKGYYPVGTILKPSRGVDLNLSEFLMRNLIFCALLNDGGTSAFDLVHKRVGAFVNNPSFGPGKFGSGVVFSDATNTSINFGNQACYNLGSTPQWTISILFKPTNSDHGSLITKGWSAVGPPFADKGWSVMLVNLEGGEIQVDTTRDGAEGCAYSEPDVWNPNEWCHLVVVKLNNSESNNVLAWANAKPVIWQPGEASIIGAIEDSTQPLILGASPGDPYNFTGVIDHAMIWRGRAFSEEEVQRLYMEAFKVVEHRLVIAKIVAAEVTHELSGQVDAMSTANVEVEVETTLSGTVSAISNTSCTLEVGEKLLSGQVDAISSVSCALEVETELSGQVDATVLTACSLEVETKLSGQVDAISSTNCSLTTVEVTGGVAHHLLKPLRGVIPSNISQLTRGILAHWPMHENTGKILADLGGNKKHGSLIGSCHFIASTLGTVLDFNGSTDYVTTGFDFDGRSVFSISGWFRRRAINNRVYVAESDGSTSYAQIGFWTDGKCYIGVNGVFASADCNDTDWHHVVFTYNGTSSKLYIDGIDQNATNLSQGAVSSNSVTFLIGRRVQSDVYSNGWIDNVIIYNRMLSEAEVKLLYRTYLPAYEDQVAVPLITIAEVTHELTGQINGVSTISATVEVETILAGQVNAVASTSCTLTTGEEHELTGQVDGVSSTQCSLSVETTLSGQADAVATTECELQRIYSLTGITGNTHPWILGTAYHNNYINNGWLDVSADGNWTVMASYSGGSGGRVSMFDTSDPYNPVETDYIDYSTEPLLQGVESVRFLDGTSKVICTCTEADAIVILNTSNKYSISVFSSKQDATLLEGAEGIDLSADTNEALVACYWGNRLASLDISDRSDITILQSKQDATNFGHAVFVKFVANDTRALVTAASGNRFTSVNVSDLEDMTVIQGLSDALINNPCGFDVNDDETYAFVAISGNDRVLSINIEDLSDMTIDDDITVTQLDYAKTPVIIGNFLAVTASYGRSLCIINIVDPTSMTFYSHVYNKDKLWGADDLKIVNRKAYISPWSCKYFSIVQIPPLESAVQASLEVLTLLSGQVNAVSDTTCTLTVAVQTLSGQVDAVSSTSCSLDVETELSGTVSAVSTASCGLNVQKQLSGQTDAVSSVVGELEVDTPMLGQVDAVSTAICSLTMERAIAGIATAQLSTQCDVNVLTPLDGQITVVSTITCTLTPYIGLDGAVDANVITLADVQVGTQLEGEINAVSVATCNLSAIGEQTLSGQVDAVSSVDANLLVETGITGQVSAVATTEGLLNVETTLSGDVSAVSVSSCDLEIMAEHLLQGLVSAISSTIGEVKVETTFEATVVCVSMVTGELKVVGVGIRPLINKNLAQGNPLFKGMVA